MKERKERTEELQSIESNDVLKAKNVEMKNICLVNKVADCLFEAKIQSLIKSYAKVQDAFHTIQVKTVPLYIIIVNKRPNPFSFKILLVLISDLKPAKINKPLLKGACLKTSSKLKTKIRVQKVGIEKFYLRLQ